MKYRTVGLASNVMQAMGASVAQLPGPEILPAMEKGVIEAFEFNNPTSDMRFGAQDVAKFYYMGSYHQASEAIEVVYQQGEVGQPGQGAAADPACWPVRLRTRTTSGRRGTFTRSDLQTLITKHGVKVKRTSDSIFKAQLAAWDKVVDEISADASSGTIHQEGARKPEGMGQAGWLLLHQQRSRLQVCL